MQAHEVRVDPDPTSQVMERLLNAPLESIVVARYRHRLSAEEATDVLVRTGVGGWTHTIRNSSGLGKDAERTYWDERVLKSWVQSLYKFNSDVTFFVIEMDD